MSKTAIKVFALPTEKAQVQQGQIYKNGDDYGISSHTSDRWNDFIPICIYITTSESPKEGDWFIVEISEDNWETSNFVLEQVETINGIWVNNESYETTRHINNCRKVVATDNSELHYKGVFNEKLQRRTFGDVPQISPEFQQAWVREANKSTPIVEAMIEMDIIYTLNERFTLDNLDEAEFVNQTEVENEHGTVFPASYLSKVELEFAPKSYQPKLNPQGYVTILPVKEKMYPLDALRESFKGARRLLPSNDEESDFNKWLKMYETVNL